MPWCVKKCPYCDFNSHPRPKGEEYFNRYIQALKKEFSFLDQTTLSNRELISIYFGGGTPTLFNPKYFADLLNTISQKFKFANDIEISMEANPGTVSEANIAEYKASGINRVSLGIQSLNPSSLKLLKRIHTREEAINAIQMVQKHFSNFNLDLMHSLPNQTLDDALRDLQEVIDFNPSHLSWYQLTLEENTIFGQNPPTLPEEEVIDNIYLQGYELLSKHGYQHYEVSAFCRDNRYCKHNVNYWKFGDYISVGAGAHSKETINGSIIRKSRVENPFDYINAIEQQNLSKLYDINSSVDKDDLPFEYFLNRLRLFSAFDLQEFTDYTGLPLDLVWSKLDAFAKEELIVIKNNKMTITDKGHLFVNHMLESFL